MFYLQSGTDMLERLLKNVLKHNKPQGQIKKKKGKHYNEILHLVDI